MHALPLLLICLQTLRRASSPATAGQLLLLSVCDRNAAAIPACTTALAAAAVCALFHTMLLWSVSVSVSVSVSARCVSLSARQSESGDYLV